MGQNYVDEKLAEYNMSELKPSAGQSDGAKLPSAVQICVENGLENDCGWIVLICNVHWLKHR